MPMALEALSYGNKVPKTKALLRASGYHIVQTKAWIDGYFAPGRLNLTDLEPQGLLWDIDANYFGGGGTIFTITYKNFDIACTVML